MRQKVRFQLKEILTHMIHDFCSVCKKITLFFLRVVSVYFYNCKLCKSEFTTTKQLSNIIFTLCKNCKKETSLIFIKYIIFTHLCSECRSPAVFNLNEDSNLNRLSNLQIENILNSVRF